MLSVVNSSKLLKNQTGRRPRWQNRRMQSSPLPMNTPKIYLHVEQFSLKTNWRLAERLLHSQDSKKEHMVSSRKGREAISLGPGPLGGDTEEEGVTWAWRYPPQRVSSSNHILGTPALGSDTRKTSPLNWFENQWD